jgi:uncharacterized protein YndB with AHSA1/START domain
LRAKHAVRIEAPVLDVWRAMTDVEGWPRWAPPLKRVISVDGGPLRVGSRVRIRPKRMPAAMWLVTEVEEQRSFTWRASPLPGLHVTAGHTLTTDGDATVTEMWLVPGGVLGRLFGWMLDGLVFGGNPRLATEGLKRYVEGRPPR